MPKQNKNSRRLDYVENSGDVVTNAMLVTEKEMDKAYFMLYVCPVVKRKWLVLENTQQEAKEYLDAGSRMAAVYYYLTDPDSPIYDNEEKIRTIALALGVVNAERPDISLDEVKLALIKHVEHGESIKDQNVNVDAFKKATTLPEYYKKRAQVFRAMDNQKLRFDQTRMCYEVKYGDSFIKLIDVTSRDVMNPEDALLRILDNNDDVRNLFLRALDERDEELTREILERKSMDALRGLCKDKDIPHFGKKKEVIISELADKLGL